uniref:Uncharacterized protein n=1 Tax=Chenopodium quinoa TaxID=63459 RepID=A0A803MDE2_CHEQI
MYHSWAALFKVLVRVNYLHNHIIPPTKNKEKAAYEDSKSADPALWKRLDAAVLQWIYGTISTDLLHDILLKDDTTHGAWTHLESMFQDNKASQTSHLEQELADLDFETFSSIDGYCNHIKSLVNRLADAFSAVAHSSGYTPSDIEAAMHALRNNPLNLDQQTDQPPPRHVASTDPPQPTLFSLEPNSSIPLPPHPSPAELSSSSPLLTPGTVTLLLNQQPISPPSSPMQTGPVQQEAHQPSTNRHTPPATPLPNSIPHPMTTRAKNGMYKPNSKYFSNLATTTTTTISPLPKDPVSAIREPN